MVLKTRRLREAFLIRNHVNSLVSLNFLWHFTSVSFVLLYFQLFKISTLKSIIFYFITCCFMVVVFGFFWLWLLNDVQIIGLCFLIWQFWKTCFIQDKSAHFCFYFPFPRTTDAAVDSSLKSVSLCALFVAPQCSGQMFKKLESILAARFSQFQPQSLIDMIHACIHLERFPLNYINKIFSPYFLQKLQGKNKAWIVVLGGGEIILFTHQLFSDFLAKEHLLTSEHSPSWSNKAPNIYNKYTVNSGSLLLLFFCFVFFR